MKRKLAFLLTLALSFGAITSSQPQTTYAAAADEMRIFVVQRNVTPIKLQGTVHLITPVDKNDANYDYYNQNKLVSVKATVDGKEYDGEVAANGKDFSIIYDAVNFGAKVKVEATDIHGCILNKTYTIKNQDFLLNINTVFPSDTAVTGETTPNAKISVYIGGKDKEYCSKADKNGNFKVKIPKQKIGTKIRVDAVAPNGFNTSETTKVTKEYVRLHLNQVYKGDTKVSGSVTNLQKGDYIKIQVGKKIYTIKIKKNYKKYSFKQTVPALHTGDYVHVIVYNSKEMSSFTRRKKVHLSDNIKIGMHDFQIYDTDWGEPEVVIWPEDESAFYEYLYFYDRFSHPVTLVTVRNDEVISITYFD